MAQWVTSSAQTALRTLLADSDGDKFEFKVPVYPVPDGVTKVFSLGRLNIIEDSAVVYLNGAETDVDLTPAQGNIEFSRAPAVSGSVLASFGYQWFTDAQILQFLESSCQLLGFETIPDVAPVQLRPVVLDFASYQAYQFQAALAAEELVVSAGGYTAQQSRTHPNWAKLAETAFARAQAKLKIYTDAALGTASPALAFTSFTLPNYQGR